MRGAATGPSNDSCYHCATAIYGRCRYVAALLSFLVGVSCLIAGAVTLTLSGTPSSLGVVAGSVITLAGFTGVISTLNSKNRILEVIYITFCVIAAVLSAIVVFFLMLELVEVLSHCAKEEATEEIKDKVTEEVQTVASNIMGVNLTDVSIQNTVKNPTNLISLLGFSRSCKHRDLTIRLYYAQIVFCAFEFEVAIMGLFLACTAFCCGTGNNGDRSDVNEGTMEMV